MTKEETAALAWERWQAWRIGPDEWIDLNCRPWWCWRPGHLNDYWRRCDGGVVPVSLDEPPHVLAVRLAAYDKEHPLPRPAFRVGQVWLAYTGAEHMILADVDGLLHYDTRQLVALLAGPSKWGRDMPWWEAP